MALNPPQLPGLFGPLSEDDCQELKAWVEELTMEPVWMIGTSWTLLAMNRDIFDNADVAVEYVVAPFEFNYRVRMIMEPKILDANSREVAITTVLFKDFVPDKIDVFYYLSMNLAEMRYISRIYPEDIPNSFEEDFDAELANSHGTTHGIAEQPQSYADPLKHSLEATASTHCNVEQQQSEQIPIDPFLLSVQKLQENFGADCISVDKDGILHPQGELAESINGSSAECPKTGSATGSACNYQSPYGA